MATGKPSIADLAEAAVAELESIVDFVRWGASRFGEAQLAFGHGTDNAIDEALALTLHALGLEPGLPDELLRARLTAAEKRRVVELLVRRVDERIPAAYLTGYAWFAGLRFRVDPRVLVPRSPIAEWIERGFEPWLEGERVARVLDVGTGSGCIAVACAFAFPASSVDAVDVSAGALEVARRNVAEHGLDDRVRVFESDVYAAASPPYDLVVSNPPYVDAATMAGLPREYAHEPAAGLAAGADGLDVVARLVDGAKQMLAPGGILVVEVGASRPALEARYPGLPFVWLELERGGENVLLLRAEDL
ncbi:MAG: 50S ribosomal protein L3 N(5)-glutamine methyltransferase [Gammaproteobacteria bacterium]|nr:50S ribosomal protein L3 N(5)-glutamine methyltransferase [Gammaproteobacteria bacterium]